MFDAGDIDTVKREGVRVGSSTYKVDTKRGTVAVTRRTRFDNNKNVLSYFDNEIPVNNFKHELLLSRVASRKRLSPTFIDGWRDRHTGMCFTIHEWCDGDLASNPDRDPAAVVSFLRAMTTQEFFHGSLTARRIVFRDGRPRCFDFRQSAETVDFSTEMKRWCALRDCLSLSASLPAGAVKDALAAYAKELGVDRPPFGALISPPGTL